MLLRISLAASLISAAAASIFSGETLEAVAAFPQDSVAYNGQPNLINVRLINHSKKSLALSSISAAFREVGGKERHLANTTASKYTLVMPAEGNRAPVEVPYQFYSELKPQDCGFVVYVDYKDAADVNIKNSPTQRVVAYDGTITIKEPKGSLFDIQLLILYPLLIAILGLPMYWGYKAFVAPKLLGSKTPTKKRSKSTSVVAKSPTPRAVSPSPGAGKEGVYDESWIPDHHMVRRSVSGRNLVKRGTAGITPTASGNATSDGETSGAEGTAATPRRSARANKGKKA